MVVCSSCSSDIDEDTQYYRISEMGPEITCTIHNILGQEVDENGTICEQCFSNIMETMYAAPFDTSPKPSAQEYEHPHDNNVCVWCRSSLFMRRTHSLTGRAREFIADIISLQNVPDYSLVCYACWTRVRQSLQSREQNIVMAPESRETSIINTNSCVWCLRSLARTRRHLLPEGPERDEIISRIFPREIPSGGLVCYACWVAARRNIQRAKKIDDVRQNYVSAAHHHNNFCALCSMSLFRRHTHALPSGPERQELAARIHPRELSGHLVCTSCWTLYVRRNASQKQQENEATMSTIENVQVSTMELDDFAHTTNSSRHCFVPHCTNPERLTTTRGRELKKAVDSDSLNILTTGEPTYWPTDPKKTPDLLDFLLPKEFQDFIQKWKHAWMVILTIQQ